MMWRGVFAVLWLVLGFMAGGPADATSPDNKDIVADPNLPRHADVCSSGVVSRRLLAYQLLVSGNHTRAIVRMSRDQDGWHRIFTDDNFCKSDPACVKEPNGEKCQACADDQDDARTAAVAFFTAVNDNLRTAKQAFKPSEQLVGLHHGDRPNVGTRAQMELFFAASSANDDHAKANSIACTSEEPPAPPAPYNALKDTNKLRVRGLSDDLYIDRTNANFKATSQASGSFSDDTHAAHTSTTKIAAAIGYAIDTIPRTQIVPYVSLNESLTDTQLKPRTKDPTNNVATGVLWERYFLNEDDPWIAHVVSVKPQYLWNTTDHSELASVRMSYAPWIESPAFNLNTFRQLPFLPGPTWGQIVFDIRNDAGTYTNRGNTLAIVRANQDFDRIGSRFGVVLTTDNFPAITFSLTETAMYGVSGFYRSVEQTQASLTYKLVSDYLGLTATYKRGRDLDTAVGAQIWTLGLTARY